MKDITQKEFSETLDNPIDQAGNKIKLRSVSHENLVRHLKNIPYKKEKKQKAETKINLPKETKTWDFVPKQYMDYISIGRKPINVKETMLNNIKKHSEMVETTQEIEIENKPVIEVNQPVEETPEGKESEIVVNNTDDVNVNVNDNDNDNDINTNTIEQSNDLNVEKTYEDINNIRQQILSKKEEAENAQKEAEKSDIEVQELEVKYTEVQKQLQEAKNKNQEMKAKLLTALKNQTEILTNQTKKYDILIEEANKRKIENMNMTKEMQPKINITQDETTTINNDTARIEEYLKALTSDNIVEFPVTEDSKEEKVRKIV